MNFVSTMACCLCVLILLGPGVSSSLASTDERSVISADAAQMMLRSGALGTRRNSFVTPTQHWWANRAADFRDIFTLGVGASWESEKSGSIPPSLGIYLEATKFLNLGFITHNGVTVETAGRGAGVYGETKTMYALGPYRAWKIHQFPSKTVNFYKDPERSSAWARRMAALSRNGRELRKTTDTGIGKPMNQAEARRLEIEEKYNRALKNLEAREAAISARRRTVAGSGGLWDNTRQSVKNFWRRHTNSEERIRHRLEGVQKERERLQARKRRELETLDNRIRNAITIPAKQLIHRDTDFHRQWLGTPYGWQTWFTLGGEVGIGDPITHHGIKLETKVDVSEVFDFLGGFFFYDFRHDDRQNGE